MWDGFGVHYVEARHTRDYKVFPQDYGGFKYLDESERERGIELVFGEDGLKPGLLKIVLDPLHEPVNDSSDPYPIRREAFDHPTAAKWIRHFPALARAGAGNAARRLRGIGLLGTAKPGLHAWTISYRWGGMKPGTLEEARKLIHTVKCNGLIPWATAHNDEESDKFRPPLQFRVSGNANSPFKTNQGGVEITKASPFFEHVCRTEEPGMAAADVTSEDPEVGLISFSAGCTRNTRAVTVLSLSKQPRPDKLGLRGARAPVLDARVTTDPGHGDRN